MVNEAHLARSWVINQVKFYTDKHAKHPIETNTPSKAFASSSYLGYEPGSAFDNKSSTYWLPNGWYDRGAGEDFIGYEFDVPVAVNSIRVIHQSGQGNVVSKKMYVEASDAYGGPYVTKWIIENTKEKSSRRFNNKSKCFKEIEGIARMVKYNFQSVLRMLRVCLHFCFEFVDTLHFGDSVHEVFESAITGR